MTRVASLDLLRGTAALSVAIPHFFIYNADQAGVFETVSVLAVEVFFVLSGFVLAPQILVCMRRGSFNTLLRFLTRRWMRTIPPYAVALVVISVLFRELGSPDFWRYLFYVQNLWRQSNSNDYFAIAWSLSVEEWFYVCFPLLLLLVARMFGTQDKRLHIVVALVAVVAIAALRAYYGDFENWGAEVRRVVVFRIDAIMYGFLLFALIDRLSLLSNSVVCFLLLALSSIVGLEVTAHISNADSLAAKHAFPFVAAAFGMLAIAFFRSAEAAIDRFAFLRNLSLFLGKVSYSVYLFHLHVLYLVRENCTSLPLPAQFAVYVVSTIAFATFFFYFFEKPILAARPRLNPVERAVPLAA